MNPVLPQADPLPPAGPPGLFWLLLMITFTLHVVAMNAVLGGSIMGAAARWLAPGGSLHYRRLAALVGASLPVAIAAAVSLGVAALLFLQVLYGRVFFVSSVLMAWLWLAVVPLLIVAYYASYALGEPGRDAARRARGLAVAIAGIFIAIAFIYSNNMSLMLRVEALPALFAQDARGLHLNSADPTMLPRFLHIVLGAVASASVMLCVAGLALRRREPAFAGWAIRRGALWFGATTALNVPVGIWWLGVLPPEPVALLTGGDAGATAVLATGMVLTLVPGGLLFAATRAGRPGPLVAAAAAGLLVGLVLMLLTRDFIRQEALEEAGVRRRIASFNAALLAQVTLSAQQRGWSADSANVATTSALRPGFNFDEANVRLFVLPDALLRPDGTRIRTAAAWRARRPEIVELFRANMYGRRPGKPQQLRFETVEETAAAVDGAASRRRVAVVSRQDGREHRFELTVLLPNTARRRVPVFLLIHNRAATGNSPSGLDLPGFWPARAVIAHGYGIAVLQNTDLAPDDRDRFREGVIRLFEGTTTGDRPADAWGALAAWSWGASRALDYLETDRRIDASRVAVIGHSRGGKAALWAGAEDERFALVISNESGEGGAALTRRNFGETLGHITETFPHWFAPRYRTFAAREESLPFDQHMLLALIAPRALYVGSANVDLWADPRGEFLSLVHSSSVYALWRQPRIGPDDMPPLDDPLIAGRRAYHVRSSTHGLTLFDWERYLEFADRLWRR